MITSFMHLPFVKLRPCTKLPLKSCICVVKYGMAMVRTMDDVSQALRDIWVLSKMIRFLLFFSQSLVARLMMKDLAEMFVFGLATGQNLKSMISIHVSCQLVAG